MRWVPNALTPEGLAVIEEALRSGVTRIREVGNRDEVIFEYEVHHRGDENDFEYSSTEAASISFLVRKLGRLNEEVATLRRGKIVESTEYKLCNQNRKRAVRRLQRWVAEHPDHEVEVPAHLLELVDSTVGATDPDEVGDPDPASFYEDGTINYLIEHHRRSRQFLLPIVVLEALPRGIHSLLYETREAFRLGLFRSSVALCRTVLEELAWHLIDRCQLSRARLSSEDAKSVGAVVRFVLRSLDLSSRVADADHVVQLAKDVLHEGVEVDEPGALMALRHTTRLVQDLVNAGVQRAR